MNLYKILDVEQNIDSKNLKSKYNQLVLKWHPDKLDTTNENDNITNEENLEKYKNIVHAYSILSDPKKREEYDIELELDNTIANIDISYIYNRLFNIILDKPKKEVINSRIDISLLELYNGVDKTVKIETNIKCNYCCSGCIMCSFSCYQSQLIDYTFHINKGSYNDDVIPIFGISSNIINRICINEVNETSFIRKGSNLYYTMDITLKESFDTTNFNLLFIDNTNIEIPNDDYIRPDSITTIKNKGMPIKNKPGLYGDLIIKYNILYPENINKIDRLEISKRLPKDYTKLENTQLTENILDEKNEVIEKSSNNNIPTGCPMQ
jgi:DnaJ-class molecular chaperone